MFFLSRLASATSVVDALIEVFASTREAREGRENRFFSFQYLCQLVVFGCHSTCSASCIKWFIPANWVFQRWCVDFSSRVVSARDNSWQTTRAKLLVLMVFFHWRPIMSQAVNITVFLSYFRFLFFLERISGTKYGNHGPDVADAWRKAILTSARLFQTIL